MSNSNGGCLTVVGTGLILGAVVLSNVGFRVLTYQDRIPCDLIRVENVRSGDSSTYRVFCEQETLDIGDDWYTGNFRSSDLYGQVANKTPGTRIYFDGYGARVGFLSMKRTVFRFSPNQG